MTKTSTKPSISYVAGMVGTIQDFRFYVSLSPLPLAHRLCRRAAPARRCRRCVTQRANDVSVSLARWRRLRHHQLVGTVVVPLQLTGAGAAPLQPSPCHAAQAPSAAAASPLPAAPPQDAHIRAPRPRIRPRRCSSPPFSG